MAIASQPRCKLTWHCNRKYTGAVKYALVLSGGSGTKGVGISAFHRGGYASSSAFERDSCPTESPNLGLCAPHQAFLTASARAESRTTARKLMTTDLESSEASHAAGRSAERSPSGPRRLWFPFVWLLVVGGLLLAFWLGGAEQDRKNGAVIAAYLLFFAGLSIWIFRSSGWSRGARWFAAIAPWTLLLAASPWGPIKLVPNGNMGIADWRWRWGPAPDERLDAIKTRAVEPLDWNSAPNDYPAFLGGGPWAEVDGVEVDVDRIRREQPKLLWKQPIGAGWSGFAVVGDYAVTQEQRGEQELVTCYEVATGELLWSHGDEMRFDQGGRSGLGGIGPRATPTVHQGRVYTQGAAGLVNCIEAATGELLWSRNTLYEFSTNNLLWGKSASPLVVDGKAIVAVGGESCSVVAYDLQSGELIWAAGDRRASYASPIVAEISGVRQLLSLDEGFLTARRLDDGSQLWEHPWPGNSDANPAASNPVPFAPDRIFLSKGYGLGAEVIEVERTEQGPWNVRTIWRRPVLKTKMSNVLVRGGYVYGIDDVHLSCVDLATGKRMWKHRRRPQIGDGQILLVGDHILALSEYGEVVFIAADPEQYREEASFQALEGVTWNNPAVAGKFLLVRNATEAACFELPLVEGAAGTPSPASDDAVEATSGDSA